MKQSIRSLKLQGYRPFRDIVINLGSLEVIVGANGAGKSSLFEFLKFLRDGVTQEIPAEIIAGSIGQQIFHIPGPEKFSWSLEIDEHRPITLNYQGELLGPVGRSHVAFESVKTSKPLGTHTRPYIFMDVREKKGVIRDPELKAFKQVDVELKRSNQLALSTITNPALVTLYSLREYIQNWRFYSSFNINNSKIRKSIPTEQEPILHEDAGNLSSVLHFLMTEKRDAFDELQFHLRSVVPGFKGLNVKARGGPGEIIAFWREDGVDNELSLADLSDGILRLICWITLCVQPNPPSLICIDEPDQGVHPRTLPVLASLFNKASERTQILLTTHASYFVMQFDVENLAVMRKENGEAKFIKPKDSRTLMANLEDFGQEEIEIMHRSDELEKLS